MLLLSTAIANAGWAYGATATCIVRESIHRRGRDNSDRADHVYHLRKTVFLVASFLKVALSHGYRDFYRYRGAVGSLTRSRPANDPELLAARSRMAEESLVDAVAKALKKSPSLRPAVRERINALLDGAS
jgi:hypothetical protein